MSSIRQEKVGELVKQELSIIFQRNTSIRFDGIFITVTIVRMSPDLGLAKVFLSFLVVKEPEEALNKIKRKETGSSRIVADYIKELGDNPKEIRKFWKKLYTQIMDQSQ